MSKEKSEKKKKGSIGKIILLIILIFIILTIMAYLNSGFGLGAGMGGILGSGEAVDAAATAVSTAEPEETIRSEPGVVNIIISGDTITVDGEKQADMEAFDACISKMDGGSVKFRLLDDSAIDYTYTEVKSCLEKYSFAILEETTLADYKAR